MSTEPLDRETAIRFAAVAGRMFAPTEKERIVDALLLSLPITDEGKNE